MNLVEGSVQRLLAGQHPSGSFVASPDFATYRYAWLRDGTFCAYALDRWGQHGPARRFHRWVASAVRGQAAGIDAIMAEAASGTPIDARRFPPARYTLAGTTANDDWPNLQLDGYGAWLWGLGEHARLSGDPGVWAEFRDDATRCARYVETFWTRPCFDCWEENGDAVHPSTLACLFGGLSAVGEALGRGSAIAAAGRIRAFVREHGVRDGHLVKSVGAGAIDSSLLWVSVPFGLLDPRDDVAEHTARRIREELVTDGGVLRYRNDTYYGGGQWLLLTAWLGWYLARTGEIQAATACRQWIESHATPDGGLPEQVGGERRNPTMYAEWVERWGVPAKQLLWSHAMYLVLVAELEGLVR